MPPPPAYWTNHPFGNKRDYDLKGVPLTISQKQWLTELILDKKVSGAELSKLTGIATSTLGDWVRHGRDGVDLKSSAGRPSALTTKTVALLKADLRTQQKNGQLPSKEAFQASLEKAA